MTILPLLSQVLKNTYTSLVFSSDNLSLVKIYLDVNLYRLNLLAASPLKKLNTLQIAFKMAGQKLLRYKMSHFLIKINMSEVRTSLN